MGILLNITLRYLESLSNRKWFVGLSSWDKFLRIVNKHHLNVRNHQVLGVNYITRVYYGYYITLYNHLRSGGWSSRTPGLLNHQGSWPALPYNRFASWWHGEKHDRNTIPSPNNCRIGYSPNLNHTFTGSMMLCSTTRLWFKSWVFIHGGSQKRSDQFQWIQLT